MAPNSGDRADGNRKQRGSRSLTFSAVRRLSHVMAELQRNLKQGILEMLRLWASRDEQLEYRRTVPITDVSAELFCMWDEVFWPDDAALRSEFSETEWTALQRFHSVFERVLRLLPHHPLPPIEEFVQSPHWLQVSKAAARALKSFDSAHDDAAR